MAAYNGVNGATMTESPLLTDVLKDEWGFDGVVMSDWFAARSTVAAGNGGLDLAMPGPGGPWGDALVDTVRAGEVDEAAVDDKVVRLLRLAARVGALDGVAPAARRPAAWSDQEVSAELRAIAAASFVLARNEGVLPLDGAALRRVALVGPNAAVARTLGGGSATVFPAHTVSPLDGLRAALGPGVRVDHAAGPRAHARIPPAAAGLLWMPDGSGPGVEIRFLAADGLVLGGERRFGGAYAWMGTFGDDVPFDRVGAVELHGRVRAAAAGEHVIGCSGKGRFALTIGDAPPVELELDLPPGADIAEAHMRPPQDGVTVVLEEGEEIAVALRHELDEPPPDSVSIPGAMFQLNVDPRIRPMPRRSTRRSGERRLRTPPSSLSGPPRRSRARASTAAHSRCPAARTSCAARRRASPRTVSWSIRAHPCCCPGPRRSRPCCSSGSQAGVRPRARGRAARRRRAGRTAADDLAGRDEALPSTRPDDGVLAYEEDLFIGYRAYDRDGRAPLFPFGHGDGYTAWEYGALEAPTGIAAGADAVVRLRVRNVGRRAGREVVQLYAERPGSEVERPPRWLVSFAVVDAGPGEEAAAELTIPARALAHWDEIEQTWRSEPGAFRIVAGRSSRDLRCSTELIVRI